MAPSSSTITSSASVRGERAWPSAIAFSTFPPPEWLRVFQREAQRLLGGERDLADVPAAPAAALDLAVEVVHAQRPFDLPGKARPAGEGSGHQGRVVVPA